MSIEFRSKASVGLKFLLDLVTRVCGSSSVLTKCLATPLCPKHEAMGQAELAWFLESLL